MCVAIRLPDAEGGERSRNGVWETGEKSSEKHNDNDSEWHGGEPFFWDKSLPWHKRVRTVGRGASRNTHICSPATSQGHGAWCIVRGAQYRGKDPSQKIHVPLLRVSFPKAAHAAHELRRTTAGPRWPCAKLAEHNLKTTKRSHLAPSSAATNRPRGARRSIFGVNTFYSDGSPSPPAQRPRAKRNGPLALGHSARNRS